MARSGWLLRFENTLKQHLSSKITGRRTRNRRSYPLNHAPQPAEVLEERSLLSASAVFVEATGELSLELGSSESAQVSSVNGNVLIGLSNDGGPYVPFSGIGTLPASSIVTLNVYGGDDANTIDLRNVTLATFPNLTTLQAFGDDGNDVIIGSPDLANQLFGEDGNDSLTGGLADDTLNGGNGADTIIGNAGNDSITAGDGADSVLAGDGHDTISGGNGDDTISGGNGDDSVIGANGQDSLVGDAGNDTLNGDGGADTLAGGDGNDSLLGGDLNDSLVGDAGNDTLVGNSGDDTLVGVTGADILDGGVGNDLLQSALEIAGDDPVPAAPTPAPATLTPAPLPDAMDSTLGVDTNALMATIGSGTGDGSLTVQVTSTGAFGIGAFPTTASAGAPYNPLGTLGVGDTTFDSEIYFRASTTTGARSTIQSLAANPTSVRATASEANSTFEIGALHFELTQVAEPVLDVVTGQPIGSLLTQTYRITNTGATTTDFELARYLDAQLQFDGSLTDGGGRFVSTAGDEFLVATDAGGLSGSSNFVGITAKGGTIPTFNRFQIGPSPTLQNRLLTGQALTGQVFNDTNGDQSVDVNYDVTLGLRNTFRLAANASATYTTHTLFGTGTPNQVQLNQKPVAVADNGRVLAGRSQAIDVVSNDFDVDGSLVYTSIQIVQQPANGTATPLGEGRILYTPNAGFSGTDTFAYTIADNLGAQSSPAIVTVAVNAVDDIGDLLNGGNGNDTAFGSDGNDSILGGAGHDSLDGGLGNDRVQGQAGNDTLSGGGGTDTLDGGAGNDLVRSLANPFVVIPDISISDVSVTEGNSGTQTALVLMTLSEATTVPVRVLVSTADNEAQAGRDYEASSFFVTIQPGQTAVNVPITIFGDTIFEANETFFVNLVAPENGNLIDAQATVTILNDDATAATQFVFIDFDSQTAGADHIYTAAERVTIINRLNEIFAAFPVTFTVTAPTSGPFSTITANAPPLGGLASEIDFRNLNYVATATVDLNGILGGLGQPADTSANFAELTAKVIAHENGHLLGLRHNDSFGPIGSGISNLVNPADFNPAYPGPLTANESTRHIMGSPGATGETILDAISGQFFGEREAVKLSTWAFGGSVLAEQAGAHGTIATAQPIELRELFVPNTIVNGANAGQTFRVNQVTVTGNISVGSEIDLYQFQGTAGQLLNLEVISESVSTTPPPFTPRYPNSIDSVIQVLDANGVVIPYYTGTAINNNSADSGFPDPDSILFDLLLPATGTYYVQVTASAAADTGNYELYMYDFATYVPAVGGVGNIGAGATNITEVGDSLLGGDGNDTLVGASGDDTINGNAGNDSANGGGGNDLIFGGADNDTLAGGDGNDTLDGQGGNDRLLGDDGDDVFVLGNGAGGNDFVDGGEGFNQIRVNGTGSSDSLTIGANNKRITASRGLATITADNNMSVQRLVVNAGFGEDTVTVNDLSTIDCAILIIVNGDEGNDRLTAQGSRLGLARLMMNGNDGNDTLIGSNDGDTLAGNEGNDAINGQSGNDSIQGGAGDDILAGGLGDDTLDGGDGEDFMTGNAGHDRMRGGAGNDTLRGFEGDDTLDGQAGDDNLNGMDGNDVIRGGIGKDQLVGGSGNDSLDGGRNDDTINGNAGHDSIVGDHGNDYISAGDGNNTVFGGDGNDTILAEGGNDIVVAGDGDDFVNTDGGNDLILGGDGSDTVQGGGGNDTILGGDGDDVLNGQGGTDVVAGQQGIDIIADPFSEINEAFSLTSLSSALLTVLGGPAPFPT